MCYTLDRFFFKSFGGKWLCVLNATFALFTDLVVTIEIQRKCQPLNEGKK